MLKFPCNRTIVPAVKPHSLQILFNGGRAEPGVHCCPDVLTELIELRNPDSGSCHLSFAADLQPSIYNNIQRISNIRHQLEDLPWKGYVWCTPFDRPEFFAQSNRRPNRVLRREMFVERCRIDTVG